MSFKDAILNEDWYSDSQANFLASLYNNIKNSNGTIIEIGCWEGKSTISLANACYPEILICNDTWEGNIQEGNITGHEHITVSILKTRDVYNTFIQNMDKCTQKNYKIEKRDCLDFLKSLKEPVKFCHIDASHDYQSVYDTIQLLLPLMVPNGILCGDDFLTAHAGRTDLQGGVEKAVRELLPEFKSQGNLWFWKKSM